MPKPDKNPHSNAPEGFPDVNTDGYPLVYPLGDGNQPTGPARLYFDGQTFEDDKEVRSYVKRLERRKEFVFVNDFPATGTFDASMVMQPGNESILKWMFGARADYKMKTGRDLFFDLLKGTTFEVNTAKAAADLLNPAADPWPAPRDDMLNDLEKLYARHTMNDWEKHKGQQPTEKRKLPKVGE